MRKHIIIDKPRIAGTVAESRAWLDIAALAQAELTSEDPAYPIETALQDDRESGWRATGTGEQTIRLLFDAPTRVRRIRLLFRETETQRTQEFVLRWRSATAGEWRDIVHQQYTFSPPHTSEELEDYGVELEALSELELNILPDIGGGPARASLAQLRLA
jgi:hypothetical protein